MSLSACCCSFLLKGWASTRLNQVPPGSFAREVSIRAQRPGAFKRPSRTLFLKKIACPSASSWGNHCLALPSIAFQCLEQHPCHTGFARPDTLRMSARRGARLPLRHAGCVVSCLFPFRGQNASSINAKSPPPHPRGAGSCIVKGICLGQDACVCAHQAGY